MAKEITIKDEKLLAELEKYTSIEQCSLEELIIKILYFFLEAQKNKKLPDKTKEDEIYIKKYMEEREKRRKKIEDAISRM